MAATAASGFGTMLQSVHLSDVLDVLIVATLVFGVISGIRATSSGAAARRAAAAGVAFALVYVLADHFNLYLTTRVLRVLALLLLIALVVVFQSDIRRLVDRFLTWKFSWHAARARARSPAGVIVDTVERLAERRIGALIAIRGDDPWGPHVTGGVRLDGAISPPLLESIFDPGSAGHDGAVLVEGGRVTRFAVHLPLARRVPEISRFGGTRHAAALGLAEVRDAFVVVVSEERGSVSIAQAGRLVELESPADLGDPLERFWDAHYGPPGLKRPRWSRRTAGSALASLAIAALAWMFFSYSGTTTSRIYRAPVALQNLPVDWSVAGDSVLNATVTVAGSQRAVNELDPSKLAVTVDLSHPHAGVNRIPVTDSDVKLPPDVRLVDVVPRTIQVRLERLVSATIPVRVLTTAPLPDSVGLRVEPAALRVLLAVGDTAPAALLTRPLDPSRFRGSGGVTVPVALPVGITLFPDEVAQVTVYRVPRPAPR